MIWTLKCFCFLVPQLNFRWVVRMSSNQMPSADLDPPKFHRLFKFYDPEVVAVSGCGSNNLSLRKTDNGSLGSCCNRFLWDVLLNVFLVWIFTLTICFPSLAYDNIIRFVPAPPDYTSLQHQPWYKIFLYVPPLCWFCGMFISLLRYCSC